MQPPAVQPPQIDYPQVPQPQAPATEIQAGQEVTIDGGSFGPQAGSVVMTVGGMQLRAQVTSWTENEIRATIPALPLAASTSAAIAIMNAQGQIASQMDVMLLPNATLLAQQ